MGMAAGQARLLSITSRISDNELRSQIISNNKMRLATESSQVSEAYIAALNDAQYMFTNYDANNNVSYQQLTFNALTSYNPYNNQYALINSSNQILISETDATHYKNANGSLDNFLESYGLTKDTTYFDEGVMAVDKGFATYTYYGEDNRVITASCGFTPEQLKMAYLGEPVDDTIGMIGGNVKVADCGYDNVLNGPEMHEYISNLGTYTLAKSEYDTLVKPAMLNKLNDVIKNSTNIQKNPKLNEQPKPSTNIGELIQNIQGLNDKNDAEIDSALNNLSDFFTELANLPVTTEKGQKYLTQIANKIKGIDPTNQYNITDANGTNTQQTENNLNGSSKKANAISALTQLKANLNWIWESVKPEFSNYDDDTKTALVNYTKAANELYEVIYGVKDYYRKETTTGNTTTLTYNLPGTPNISELDDIASLYNQQDQSGYPKFQETFRPVYMNLVLDNVMDTYGEPKITWINEEDPNDNSMARMQWYTNLWNRIEQSGYHVLKDGLASSPEWIEFAFESGIVTMEQVDNFNNWNQLNYSNCSDITEQTNDKAVTIAEAEYNAAMNKIENKDKMYDMELKNIDTEHNSLQTEYESIKSALDKNIERNFKYMT